MPPQYRRPNNLSALDSVLWHIRKTDGCWIWSGSVQKAGYGVVAFNRKCILAHRLSWMAHNGDIPKGLFVCHKCDNPPCINPDHLFLGTALDNANDRDSKHRGYDRRGTKNGRSKLSEISVQEIRLRFASKENRKGIALDFGIGLTQLRRIANGVHWK